MNIGKWEATLGLFSIMSYQVLLGFPRVMIETGGPAGWMVVVYISVLATAGFAIIAKLYDRFEGQDIIEIGEIALGKFGRIFAGMVVFLYLFLLIPIVMREFSEYMKVIALPQTPISFVSLFFITCMILGAYKGLDALFRLNMLIAPFMIGGFLFIIISVLGYCNVSNLTPIMGTGMSNIFGSGFFRISTFSALIILFLLYPNIRNKEAFKFTGYVSLAGISVVYLIGTLVYSMVFPYPVALENFIPLFSISRLIQYWRFFQRIESVFLLIWATSSFFIISSGFYFMVHTFRRTFRLQHYKPLIPCFAIIEFTISLLPRSLVETVELESKYFRRHLWILIFVMPIILLVIANLRARKRKEACKE